LDPEIVVAGTLDNRLKDDGNDETYVNYEIVKCQDSLRAKVKKDPACEDKENEACEMEYEKIDPTCVPSSENNFQCPTVDPECKDMSEINKWLSTKTARFRVINR